MLIIEKVIILKSINLFSEIPEDDLLAVASELEVIKYEKDTKIINQGDLGTSMYIVIYGKVDVDFNGKSIKILEEKSIFGELALLDPEPRSASITTLEETLVFKIESDVIYNLIYQHINVAKGIIKILCQRVRDNNEN